jgi:hypothetical protein
LVVKGDEALAEMAPSIAAFFTAVQTLSVFSGIAAKTST